MNLPLIVHKLWPVFKPIYNSVGKIFINKLIDEMLQSRVAFR